MSVTPRLRRLFAADGKCLDVAVDHGFFNERQFLAGIEHMPAALQVLIDAAPDAIQTSIGMARHLQEQPGAKPALVLRTDAANVYGKQLPDVVFSELIGDAVESAVRVDAACVVINLLRLPDQPGLHRQCVRNISDLKAQCERYAMPLMVEPLVFRPNEEAGGYMVDGDPDKIVPLVRQAVELGADIIKADPTDRVEDYHDVVQTAAGIPVLVRGGGKASIEEILQRTYELMATGIKGLVYGRNIIQHADPAGMTKALMAILHEDATPEQARALVKA